MTVQPSKKENKKTGDKPTHFLKIKSEQFTTPINFTLAALWENTEKDYMGVSLNDLKLIKTKETEADNAFHIMLTTKIHGQDVDVKIGEIARENFTFNMGDIVLFPNNYEEKQVTKKQPQP